MDTWRVGPNLYNRCACGAGKVARSKLCRRCDNQQRAERARQRPRPVCRIDGCGELVECGGGKKPNSWWMGWRTVCAAHRKRAQRGSPVLATMVRRPR